jgi:hypothetical protein
VAQTRRENAGKEQREKKEMPAAGYRIGQDEISSPRLSY